MGAQTAIVLRLISYRQRFLICYHSRVSGIKGYGKDRIVALWNFFDAGA
jgi:hypothetical protein